MKKALIIADKCLIFNVGVAGFEPTTSCSQSRRDTGLRYTPKVYSVLSGERGIRTLGTVTSTTV
jgi:hypothetical protein